MLLLQLYLFFPFLCYDCHVYHYMLQTQQYSALYIQYNTLHNFISIKEAEKRQESKYIFYRLSYIYFTLSGSLTLFLLVRIIQIWCDILTPIQLWSHSLSLCCCQIYYFHICYRPNNAIIYILLYTISFKIT